MVAPVRSRVALAGSSVHAEQKKVQASTSTAADETKKGSHEPVFRTTSSASSGEMTPGRLAMVLPRPVRIPVSCDNQWSATMWGAVSDTVD